MGSILNETKQQLGLATDAAGFDPELIIHINSVLADLSQLGIGPDEGFSIEGPTEEWDAFLKHENLLSAAKALVFLRVKMLFDPPQLGYLITAYEKMIEKSEWRLNVAIEEIKHPAVPNPGVLVANPYDRDALVTVTGGLVSSIEIGGVKQNLVAGTMLVPAGQSISLTYTQAPTWIWS